MTLNQECINEILEAHSVWLRGTKRGRANLSEANLSEANLSGADLSRVNLSEANLSEANLRGANLRGANLSGADLSEADLSGANLSEANLSEASLSGADLSRANLGGANLSEANLIEANLSEANLSGADLSEADLSGANLSEANLSEANLSGADLSGAILRGANLSMSRGLLKQTDFITQFEKTPEGIIVYKTFNSEFEAPKEWCITPASILTETPNPDRCNLCGCGINVAPLEWVRKRYETNGIWRCLIRWEWLAGVVVPFNTDGKFRTEKLELLEELKDHD